MKDIPTITPYLADPSKANGAALVIFPGGGYGGLAPHEGAGYAEFFSEQGINCFVVKYRLGSSGLSSSEDPRGRIARCATGSFKSR